MKKILIALGCLFLSACSPTKPPIGHLIIKCWQKDPDGQFSTIIYSGKTNGGVGIGEGGTKNNGKPFITFRDENNERQIIIMTNRVCAAAVDSIDY